MINKDSGANRAAAGNRSVGCPGSRGRGDHQGAGPATVEISAAGRVHDVEMEFFRAENRYAPAEPVPTR